MKSLESKWSGFRRSLRFPTLHCLGLCFIPGLSCWVHCCASFPRGAETQEPPYSTLSYWTKHSSIFQESSELIFQKQDWKEMRCVIKSEELVNSRGDLQGEVMKFSHVSVAIHEFHFLWLDNLSLTLLPCVNLLLGEGKVKQHCLVALSSVLSHCFCHKAWVPTLTLPLNPAKALCDKVMTVGL